MRQYFLSLICTQIDLYASIYGDSVDCYYKAALPALELI